MTRTRIPRLPRCTHRPAAPPKNSPAIPDELLEELRQLRAALAVYRKLVDRIVERESAA